MIDPDSILGRILAQFLNREVYVAPVLGVKFVEPWVIEP